MFVDKNLVEKTLELKPQAKILLIEALVTSLDKPDPGYLRYGFKKLKHDFKLIEKGKREESPQKRYLKHLKSMN